MLVDLNKECVRNCVIEIALALFVDAKCFV